MKLALFLSPSVYVFVVFLTGTPSRAEIVASTPTVQAIVSPFPEPPSISAGLSAAVVASGSNSGSTATVSVSANTTLSGNKLVANGTMTITYGGTGSFNFNIGAAATANCVTCLGGVLYQDLTRDPRSGGYRTDPVSLNQNLHAETWIPAGNHAQVVMNTGPGLAGYVPNDNSGTGKLTWRLVEDDPKSILDNSPPEFEVNDFFGRIFATFSPVNSHNEPVKLKCLANALGFDYFNWVQWVVHDDDPNRPYARKCEDGLCSWVQPQVPYLDPPRGGWNNQPNGDDDLDGFWNENELASGLADEYTLRFWDDPTVSPGYVVKFKTALAGVKGTKTTVIGSYFDWESYSSGTFITNKNTDHSIVTHSDNRFLGMHLLSDLSAQDISFLNSAGIGIGVGVPEPATGVLGLLFITMQAMVLRRR